MTVGGKAEGLIRLATVAPVPRFDVLEDEWLSSNSRVLATAIVDRIRALELHPPFAARSSSIDEDGESFAFAGMYETIIPVDWAQLTEAVTRVWRSGNSERVQAYRAASGLPAARSDQGVSVVVQEVVDASVSGVAFSRAPWDEDAVAIEAVAGLGSTLVDGHAAPERHTVDRLTRAQLTYQPGRQYFALYADGVRRRLSGRDTLARRLRQEVLNDLVELIMKVEASWGPCPHGLDLEWCVTKDHQILLLQCRPITSKALPRARQES